MAAEAHELWSERVTDGPARAFGLIRVSTGAQVDGLGLDDQVQIIQAHCGRAEHELVRIYSDEGVPGDSEHLAKRGGLAEALESLRPGMRLVVARMDRLARDLILQETLIGLINRAGAHLESANPGEASLINGDTTDPTRVMIRQVFGAMAQYERAMIGMRLAGSRRLKGTRGGFTGGHVPFDMMIVGEGRDSRRVPNPEKQAVLRLMVRERDKGANLRQIADTLTEKGVPSPKGGPWSYSTVRRALARADQAGIV